MEVLEHGILVIIIIILIIALMFFLLNWNYSDVQNDKIEKDTQDLIILSKTFMSDPFFIRKNRILDDAKLTALAIDPNSCRKIRSYLGKPVFIEIWMENDTKILDEGHYNDANKVECDFTNYPDCNYWSFCMSDEEESLREYSSLVAIFPVVVNRYNDAAFLDKNNLATMRFGLITR